MTKRMMTQQERLIDLMENFDNAMLVTRHGDDTITARPMVVAELAENGEMWFVTSNQSGKISDITNHHNVGITFQNSRQFVSISGVARKVDDREKVDRLWSETWRVWFPDGKDDPTLTLLHVTPTDGEYWDNSGLNGLKYLVKAGVAYLQGEKPSKDENINASVKL